MSDESKRLPRRLYSFYIARLLGHPDLAPVLMRPAEVPADLASRDCRFWANATLQKRGSSFLRNMPQFARCRDIPLGKPGVRMASELLDCAP
jgi:hypothetical protein